MKETDKEEIKFEGTKKPADYIFDFWHGSYFFDSEGKFKGPVAFCPSLKLVTYRIHVTVNTRSFFGNVLMKPMLGYTIHQKDILMIKMSGMR